MRKFTRRNVIASTVAAGIVGTPSALADPGGDHSSPELEKFVQELPIPSEREPDRRRFFGPDEYEITVEQVQQQMHPDLPPTTLWGFDGEVPGPVIRTGQYQPIEVRFDNSPLPDEHFLPIDEGIPGTTTENYPGYDGPVPEVRTVTHFHGLNIPTESDGQADMWTSPDGVTGPRFSQEVHEIPNRQARMSTTYHDHAKGISRLNNYAGLVGPYIIESVWEKILPIPDGEYDVPLVLLDRMFEEDGSLHYPETFEPNLGGDVATVNGAIWPYMEVEPRQYRFRILNPSNGRTFGLSVEDGDGTEISDIYQFAAGHGFLRDVVTIGPDGDMETLYIAPFERADVIVDFSKYAGETLTVTNDAEFPFGGGHGGHDGHAEGMDEDPAITEVMQFRVADAPTAATDRQPDPTSIDLPDAEAKGASEQGSGPSRPGGGRGPAPGPGRPTPDDADEVRHMTMQMTTDDDGRAVHLLNDRGSADPIQHRPELGSTEIWELENGTMHTHPIHLHLVSFEVIGRGEDGTEPPLPNERGGKDVVRVNPDETVRILVEFGDYAGIYPFHCHILEHEDLEMMRPFEVVDPDA